MKRSYQADICQKRLIVSGLAARSSSQNSYDSYWKSSTVAVWARVADRPYIQIPRLSTWCARALPWFIDTLKNNIEHAIWGMAWATTKWEIGKQSSGMKGIARSTPRELTNHLSMSKWMAVNVCLHLLSEVFIRAINGRPQRANRHSFFSRRNQLCVKDFLAMLLNYYSAINLKAVAIFSAFNYQSWVLKMVSTDESIAIGEICVYIPLFILTTIVVFRHGFKRQPGWFYLAIFCVIRIAFAGFKISQTQNPTNKTDIGWAAILDSIGLSPLLCCCLQLWVFWNECKLKLPCTQRNNADTILALMKSPTTFAPITTLSLCARYNITGSQSYCEPCHGQLSKKPSLTSSNLADHDSTWSCDLWHNTWSEL